MTDQKQPNHTYEAPQATIDNLDAMLSCLSLDEIRFLVARSEVTTDKEAARIIGLSPSTVKGWPMERKELIRGALRLMAEDGLITALHLRRRSLAKAMAVKVKGLEAEDDRLRQSVATEIIEWELGRAAQPIEHEIDDPREEVARLLDRIAASGTEDGANSGDER